MGNLIKFCIEHFSHVFPILLSGALGVFIALERFSALVWGYPIDNLDSFFSRLRQSVMRDNVQEAIALCDRYRDKPAARVARQGLMRAHQPQSLIENGLHIAVSESAEKVQARTAFLGTIANVATLFGLLGTIIGLVQSFEAVGSATAQERSSMLANGISTAMNATILGLAVAIPCMIAYSFLMSKTNQVIAQIDESAVRTQDLLQQRYFAVESKNSEDGTFTDQVHHIKKSGSR